MIEKTQLDQLQFDKDGLLPSVVQDWLDGTVLMVGFMNQEALTETVRTQRVHFWSRSRRQLWKKGETSGHELLLKSLFVDCDQDTLLIKAEPIGPTCHTGNRSCFFAEMNDQGSWETLKPTTAWGGIVERLYETVLARKHSPKEKSYVAGLLQNDSDRLFKKVVEEAGEVVIAGKNGKHREIVHEMADLWFHTLIVLGHFGIPPGEIYQELGKRFGKSGLQRLKETKEVISD